MKRILIWVVSIIVVLGIGVAGYEYYSYYSVRKYLQEAKGYEGIGEYDKAIENYKKYLIRNPDDIKTKFDLARLLLKAKHEEQAIEVLEIVYREAKTKEVTDLRRSSYSLLKNTYSEVAEKYREEAEKAMQEKDYKLARTNYEREGLYFTSKAELTKREFGLDWTLAKLPPVDKWEEENFNLSTVSGDEIKSEYYFYYEAMGQHCENRANFAITFWLEGKYEEAREAISQYAWMVYYHHLGDREELRKYRYSYFATELNDLGSKAFKKEDYKTARKHWEEAVINYERGDIYYRDIISEVKYNIAISYYNEENYLEAKKFLTQLQKDFPKYNTKKIKTLIDDCKKASIVKNIAMLGEKADKAFDKKDYSAARSYYREILAYAKKWGNPYGSLCLANVQYNIALTYWNKRNYKKAKEYLLELRSKYPDYEKEDVQDFINRATNLGY